MLTLERNLHEICKRENLSARPYPQKNLKWKIIFVWFASACNKSMIVHSFCTEEWIAKEWTVWKRHKCPKIFVPEITYTSACYEYCIFLSDRIHVSEIGKTSNEYFRVFLFIIGALLTIEADTGWTEIKKSIVFFQTMSFPHLLQMRYNLL